MQFEALEDDINEIQQADISRCFDKEDQKPISAQGRLCDLITNGKVNRYFFQLNNPFSTFNSLLLPGLELSLTLYFSGQVTPFLWKTHYHVYANSLHRFQLFLFFFLEPQKYFLTQTTGVDPVFHVKGETFLMVLFYPRPYISIRLRFCPSVRRYACDAFLWEMPENA